MVNSVGSEYIYIYDVVKFINLGGGSGPHDPLNILHKYTKHIASHILELAKEQKMRDFPGGPMVRLHASNARGLSSIPGQGIMLQLSSLMLQICSK